MKLIFKTLTVRNFFSFGDQTTEIIYEEGINAIKGKNLDTGDSNGAGKTTLVAEALSYALYGKTLKGVEADNVINNINKKNCELSLTFSINGKDYKITRNRKPTTLELYEDDNETPLRFDSLKHTQEHIMKIIGVNYTCFCNIICLNMNKSVPFLDCKATEKRDIIENILNTEVYTKMLSIARENYLTSSKQLDISIVENQGLEEKIQIIKDSNNDTVKDKEQEIKTSETNIKTLKSELKTKLKTLENLKPLTETTNELETLSKRLIDIDNEKLKIDEDIKTLRNTLDTERSKTDEEKKTIDEKTNVLRGTAENIKDTAKAKADVLNNDIRTIENENNQKDISIKTNINSKKQHQEVLDQLNGKECPTCKTPTNSSYIEGYLKTHTNAIEELTNKNSELTTEQDNNKQKIETITKQVDVLRDELKTELSKIKAELEKHTLEKKELETKFETVAEQNRKQCSEVEAGKNVFNDEVSDIRSKQRTLQNVLDEAKDAENKVLNEKAILENNISTELSTIQKILEQVENIKKETAEDRLGKLKTELVGKKKVLAGLEEDKLYYDYMRSILNEDGIRKYIFSHILPYFNQKINEYLKLFGSAYTIIFNEKLKETIYLTNKCKMSYHSFSGGEKKRIDLAIMLALMDIAKVQNSIDTNILVLDEIIDSAIDSSGVDDFINFLTRVFVRENEHKCVYVISHRPDLSYDNFSGLINIEKKDRFSYVANSEKL